MRTSQKILLASLIVLAVASLGAVLYTRSWADYRSRLRALWLASNHSSVLVDTHSLDTAQQLAPLAVTRLEKNYAHEALRLADHSVDLAFAAALADASENPAPLTPVTRALASKITDTENSVAADQDKVDGLKKRLASSRGSAKDKVQTQLDLAQAQLSLDQDSLEDDHDDLIRAGGDKHATIQRLLDQHEASEVHKDSGAVAVSENAAEESAETTQAANILAQVRALFSLRAKQNLLRQARQDSLQRSSALAREHDDLDKKLAEEKAQRRIIRKSGPAAAPPPSPSPASASNSPAPQSAPDTQASLNLLTHLTSDQKSLTALDQRMEDEQEIAANYATWMTLVNTREQAFIHGILKSIFWIILIALLVLLANGWVQRFFAQVSMDRRQLHTARALLLFAVQAAGIILILLVVFGVPQNFATVLALAGAGLTVALKDFIMGFIGWFVLMGKGGIRPGDWVEINGVAGEVLEVGLLHTILLETGNWSDSAHPTGRKVTFNNSFAVEGHYFNFSTTGQWLWDEIEVLVPQTVDPSHFADVIQKIATSETAANAQSAEQEWRRSTPSYSQSAFSAAPSVVVRPAADGVNVSIRYLTRVNERAGIRTRLYRSIVDLLRAKGEPSPRVDAASAQD